jgi:non-ribosomal peptide synthetase component F
MFTLQNTPAGKLRLSSLTIRPVALHVGTARLDLTVDAWERPEGLVLRFEYNTDLFNPGTIARMAEHFRRLLAGAVTTLAPGVGLAPADGVGAAAGAGDMERHAGDYPADRCIHELVEAQAARTPDAVAAVFGNASPPTGR